MRRSPLDDFDVRVSVEELQTPSLWGNLQSTMSSAAGRWSAADLSGYLRRRTTVHVSVLALATAIVAGSAYVGQTPDADATFTQAATGTDSLEVSARTAIIARSIPFTSSGRDSAYVVQAGDTLTSISRQTGVNEEALLAFNGYASSDALNVGLRLRIPDLSKVPAEQLRVKDTAPHDATPLVNESSAGEALPPQKPSPELTIHEVQKGDTASKLAAAAGVTEATVMASNNLQKTTILSLGQTLVIPAISGRLVATKPGDTADALAEKYGSTTEGVLAANKLDLRTKEIAPDQLVLVPADPDVAVALLKDSPQAQSKPAAAGQTETAASVKIPAAPRPASSPGLNWPAPGAISTYFSWWHNGIDIANSVGTPVHAAQAGRVVYSGWDNSGYGYMVRIDHGNGLQTLYGHASRLIARVGDVVDEGQVIMLMGSTGRSTGSHVHFSVFQGSGYSGLNPLKYLP